MDITLVKEAKRGSRNALVRLIMDEKQDYYRLAYAYTKNQDDALDALADMIVILYEKISVLKNEACFDTWSRTILVNCCKQILRKKKKIILFDKMPEISHEGEFRQKEQEILLDSALSKLSPKHQEVLKLRFFLDFEYQTIAEILKIPVGTVRSRISTGLAKLKNILGDENYGGN
ncbi:MAG TPA: sigma-70 family RNA polymerase sigma factor [Clostridia bacterium]|nr:sigma-70 family RNA polymerase sigma factor [Clostridia bacterium]